jgi:hypothetical protein
MKAKGTPVMRRDRRRRPFRAEVEGGDGMGCSEQRTRECVWRDHNRQVFAIGTFQVGPNQTTICWRLNSIDWLMGKSPRP